MCYRLAVDYLGNCGCAALSGYRIRGFDPHLPTSMSKSIRLGDYLTEAQLRTLYGVKRVEQKKSQPIKHEELTGVAAIRAKVQWQRHKRQKGEWKSRKPYLSTEDAIARYERRGERLERGEEMFFIGQGQATRKKSDIRATTIPGGRGRRGAQVTRRPTIDEGRGGAPVYTGSKAHKAAAVSGGVRIVKF